MKNLAKKIKLLSENTGVYLFRDKEGKIIYIGKASNLKRRVKSYPKVKDARIKKMWERVSNIETEETETVIEALIKEAELIKKYRPEFNIKDNDDRSFLFLVITKEAYPRILLVRGRDLERKKYRSVFGPFVYSSEIRNALRIIRKIFPYSTHTENEIKKKRHCFYYQINLCPGTCIGKIKKKEYEKTVKNIENFFKGKKRKVITNLKKEMKKESKALHFEKAEEIKRKISALEFIQETALIGKRGDVAEENKERIEGYDISNISGCFAVGSMVVFEKGIFQKKDYRLFKIRNVIGPNDTGMIKEVIKRRLKNNWPLPSLILIDGGGGQVSAVKEVTEEEGVKIPIVGIAKGEKRKKQELVGTIPGKVKKETLLKIQEEAHRFAIKYHRKLRKEGFYK